jgi:translocation protein SEC63
MSTDYSYDEEGYLWPFFVFTLTSIVTLPLTYVLFSRARDQTASVARIQSDFRPKHSDLVDAQRKTEKKKQRKLWLYAAVAVGWVVIGYMLYLMQTTEVPSQKLWNPYDILEISEVLLACCCTGACNTVADRSCPR